MVFLLPAILCSASLPLLFRTFDDWRMSLFWAIQANYFACVVVGAIFASEPPEVVELVAQSWFFFMKIFTAKVGARAGDLIAGGVLGLINYGAIYCLVKVLSMEGWQSSQLFPIYSVGVVCVSSLLPMILFNERLSQLRKVGLLIGLFAVALLNQ